MSDTTRALVGRAVYPVAVWGSAALAFGLTHAQVVAAEVSMVLGLAAALPVVLAGERLAPYRADWQASQGDVAHDAGHTLVSLVVSQALVGLATVAAARLGGAAGGGLFASWFGDLPLLASAALYLFGLELGGYWSHRLLHRTALWRFHALHHGARRLYWLNTSRVHPVDAAFNALLSMIWAPLLGVPPAAVALTSVFVTAHLLVQHSNTDTRTAWLAPLFATGEFHRWHHAREREVADGNYGHVLGVFDVLFGTWKRGVPSEELVIGLDIPPAETFLAQLTGPFSGASDVSE